MLASGILGISMDVFKRIRYEGAGAVVTKSLSTEPWEGYLNPSVIGMEGCGYLNAVGLSNPGVKYFANTINNDNSNKTTLPIIVSLVGSTTNEFDIMTKEFDENRIVAYEINLSCPHVGKVGLEVGDDPDLVSEIITRLKKNSSLPVIAKVGLGTYDYLETVKAACQAGADAITAINTVRAMAIDTETQKPILSNGIGGLSGKPIKPVAVRCVYEISSKFDIPVIGCGGVSNWEDAIEFILAGASAVQVGSIIAEKSIDVFSEINKGITEYMDRKGVSTLSDLIGKAK